MMLNRRRSCGEGSSLTSETSSSSGQQKAGLITTTGLFHGGSSKLGTSDMLVRHALDRVSGILRRLTHRFWDDVFGPWVVFFDKLFSGDEVGKAVRWLDSLLIRRLLWVLLRLATKFRNRFQLEGFLWLMENFVMRLRRLLKRLLKRLCARLFSCFHLWSLLWPTTSPLWRLRRFGSGCLGLNLLSRATDLQTR